MHLVRRRRSRRQTLDDHERVVVATHRERRRPVAEHGDGARRVGLDPDRGRRVADVPKQRAEEQLRHRPGRYPSVTGRSECLLSGNTTRDTPTVTVPTPRDWCSALHSVIMTSHRGATTMSVEAAGEASDGDRRGGGLRARTRVAPHVRAALAAFRPHGGDRPGGDPGPTGHGIRRARRAASGERPLHHDRLPHRLRPDGAVEDPGARPGLITGAADLRRHHPARRGRRRPCHRHRPGRHARHPGRPHRDRAGCRQVGLRCRPALERGPGRLHERTGDRHHRRAAAEAQRVLDGRRHLRRGGA